MIGRIGPRFLATITLALLVALSTACSQPSTAPSAPPAAAAEPAPTVTDTPTPAVVVVPTATPTATRVPPAPTATSSPTPTRAAPEARPMAIVIENEAAARPQAGLNEADVVYEAVAEFNLTRFVAVFLDATAETVGPVRSGRAYHAAIAAEYQAGFAHCLDVPPVAGVIAASKALNIDGCRQTNPLGFWRMPGRVAPHNLYVSVPDLQKAAGGTGTYGGFGRRSPWPPTGGQVGEVSFIYPEEHPVVWRFEAPKNRYLRWQDGEPHVDDSGQQVAVSSVIVQQVAISHSQYWGEWGYHELTTIGSGDATLYANGTKRVATWRRGSYAEPTRFVDSHGEEIPLPPGRIFVQLVGVGTAVEEIP